MRTLMTIGYEGAALSAFMQTLVEAEVDLLIDVRELPLSRRRGFSKRALSETLRKFGIEYVHLKALGDPKAGRDAARRGDDVAFRRIFNHHLSSVEAKAAIEKAAAYATAAASCLMCYEREHRDCHRTIVASALADLRNFRVRHLSVPPPELRRSPHEWYPNPTAFG